MKGRISEEILRLAVPAIVSNITTPLLGLVDTAITGHMGSAVYVGAIAVGGTMFSLTYWALNFLRMGTSGMTARAYGAGSYTMALLGQSLQVAALLAITLIAVSPWLGDLLLWCLDADTDTTALARQYYSIVIWGAPAVLGTYALTGWFLGMQDSKAPMWMALVTNVSNIAISLVLVYGMGLKIVGVACGTLCAQWIGLLLGLVLTLRYRSKERGKEGLRTSWREFFTVNGDIFLRTLCLAAVTMWFTRAGASQGADVLAANALLMQLFILFSFFMDGFAFAGEAMSGKYYGSKDRVMLRATVHGIFRWGIGVAVMFTLVYIFAGKWILEVLTDTPSVVEVAMQYRWWAVAIPAAGVMAFVWDGIFIGTGMTRQMLASMAAAALTFFLLYYLLIDLIGNHGLWIAFVSYLIIRGTAQTALWRHRWL